MRSGRQRWESYALKVEGTMSQGKQVASRTWKGKETPLAKLFPHLDFNLIRLILAFWPPKHKRIHFCCVKPLSRWQFVTAALGPSHRGWKRRGPWEGRRNPPKDVVLKSPKPSGAFHELRDVLLHSILQGSAQTLLFLS